MKTKILNCSPERDRNVLIDIYDAWEGAVINFYTYFLGKLYSFGCKIALEIHTFLFKVFTFLIFHVNYI